MASFFIRPRNGGKAFELRIRHALLGKPRYLTFDLRAEAERAAERALTALAAGAVPDWLQARRAEPQIIIAKAISDYRSIRAVPASSRDILDTLATEIGSRPLASLDYQWAEGWIRSLKLDSRLAPGTIRKKKGALSRVLDWVVSAHPLWLAMNPLHLLPHGYSGYDEYTRQVLAEQGHEIPGDIERNRRVDPNEERRIVELLERRIALAASMEERAEAEGLSLMFQLALQTAMRMREIYTLTMDQVQVETHKTIFLIKTKNGDNRQVPLTPEARALLSRPWPALEAVRQGGRLFPFWNGAGDEDTLKETTSTLSKKFVELFKEARSAALHFHDSRHEALCRWVLRFPTLTSEELGRAAGMQDARTRMRYLSMRGSEIANKFG